MNVRKLRSSTLFRYGLPMLVLCIGGSFALKEFTRIRYIFRRVKPVEKEELKRLGWQDELPLQAEYEETRRDVDIDKWENIRAPRPWEEDTWNLPQQKK